MLSKLFVQHHMEKEDEQVIIVQINIRATILFHNLDICHNCSVSLVVRDTGSSCPIYAYLQFVLL